MMEITTSFDLGQKVWTIHRSNESVKIPCLFCRGKKQFKIEAPSGEYEWVSCPKCKGVGSAQLVAVPIWRVRDQPLTIGKVDVEITRSNGLPGKSEFSNYGPQDGREERYMCVETGVGSGSLHSVDKLFATSERALDAAEDLNEAILEGRGDWKPDYHDVQRARGFLDHRDVYEHTAEHVELAEAIVAASEYVREEVSA